VTPFAGCPDGEPSPGGWALQDKLVDDVDTGDRPRGD